MAIDFKTWIEQVNQNGTNVVKQEPYVDATPTIKINTDVMKEYNPSYNPTEASGVSGILGTTPSTTQTTTTSDTTTQQSTAPVSNVSATLDNVTTAQQTAQKTADEQLALAQKTSEENKSLALQQEQDRIARETEYAKQKAENEKANLAQQQAYETEYQNQLAQRAQQQTDTIKPLLDSEASADKAAAVEMKLKQDNAEKQAQISMDVEKQRAALNINRMGLAFSTSGINTILSIHDQWTTKLAELSSTNATSQANLAVAIEKNKVDHANTMNKIINDSVDGILASKKKVSELITTTNNNILLTEKQKNDNIDKAVSDYRKEKQAQEDSMYQKVQEASNATITRANAIATTVQKQQDNSRNDLSVMLQTWVLSKMSPAQILQLEQKSWLPVGTANYMMKDSVVKSIAANLSSLIWFGIAQIPSDTLGLMTSEIMNMTKMGIPTSQATTQVMDKYLKNNPDYQEAVKNMSAGSKQATAIANAQYKQAQTALAEAKTTTEEEKALTQVQTTALTKAKAENQSAIMQAQIAKYKKAWTSKWSGSSWVYPWIVMWADWLPYKQSAKWTLTSVTGAAFIWERNSPSWTIYLRADGSEVNKAWQVVKAPIKTSDASISWDTKTTITWTKDGWQTWISNAPYIPKWSAEGDILWM